jgi:hypothetical protein
MNQSSSLFCTHRQLVMSKARSSLWISGNTLNPVDTTIEKVDYQSQKMLATTIQRSDHHPQEEGDEEGWTTTSGRIELGRPYLSLCQNRPCFEMNREDQNTKYCWPICQATLSKITYIKQKRNIDPKSSHDQSSTCSSMTPNNKLEQGRKGMPYSTPPYRSDT